MYKLLLDTNVLLDFMVPDRPESDAAVEIIRRCSNGTDVGCVCAGSLKDAYYVACKHLGEQTAHDFVRVFLEALSVAPLDEAMCKIAANSNEPDFEDALVRATAEHINANLILTRDAKAYEHSTVRAISPQQFVDLFC